jgi:hypothetical protein
MSAGKYTPPIISVEQRGEDWMLMATNYNKTEPCGERLLRGEPWPAIQFRHSTKEAAEKDAALLREYLAECASGKRKDVEVRRGWWE